METRHLVIVSALTLWTTSCATAPARPAPDPHRCEQKDAQGPNFESAETFFAAAKAAYESKDPKRLADLATCRKFAVGTMDSDNAAYVDPYRAAPIMMKLLAEAPWSKTQIGDQSIMIVRSDDVWLTFNLTEVERSQPGPGWNETGLWQWTGFWVHPDSMLWEFRPAARR